MEKRRPLQCIILVFLCKVFMLLNVDLCFEDYNNTKMRSEVKNF